MNYEPKGENINIKIDFGAEDDQPASSPEPMNSKVKININGLKLNHELVQFLPEIKKALIILFEEYKLKSDKSEYFRPPNHSFGLILILKL